MGRLLGAQYVKSTPDKRAMWPLHILCALIALLAAVGVLLSFSPASAIFGQGHQSYEVTGDLAVAELLGIVELLSKDLRPSSIDLARKLEVIEFLSKTIHVSLTKAANIPEAQEVGTVRATNVPNPGPSPPLDNRDLPPSPSLSEKKPDGPPAPHPAAGNKYPSLEFVVVVLILCTIFGSLASAATS